VYSWRCRATETSLVVGYPLWATNTYSPASTLALRADGKLVIYNAQPRPLPQIHPNGQRGPASTGSDSMP
jgi:hypothetical protein